MSGAVEIARDVRARKRSAVEVVLASLDAIAARNGPLNAVVQVFPEHALVRAKDVDAGVASGRSLPLAGVPVAVKDNLCFDHGRTTCASRILEHYESPYTASALRRLLDAGAIVVGKTNLDEFGMGSSTERSCFGVTRNPWDLSRVPGGSSGGSAAAVAAGVVPIALGTDTGGSIRQPASHCGIVGIKPTYGRVSRYGLVAYASSLDQIGPMAASVSDAAAVLGVLCGPDPLDATCSTHAPPDFAARLETPIEGLTIGVPSQARGAGLEAGVAAVFDASIERFRRSGARIVDVDLAMSDVAIAAYYIVASAEASSNLARFDGVRYGRRAELKPGEGLMELYCRSRSEGFGPEVQRRIMLGTHVLSSGYYDAYYATALKARRRILEDYERAFARGCHAIFMPASPGPAFKIGEKTSDPLAMYLEDVFTVGVNLAGLPAISVPAGFAAVDGKRLPVGMQLIGAAFDEGTILRVARVLERTTGDLGRPSP